MLQRPPSDPSSFSFVFICRSVASGCSSWAPFKGDTGRGTPTPLDLASHPPMNCHPDQSSARCARPTFTVLLLAALLSTAATVGYAANTEPSLALVSAAAARGSSGRVTVTLEGSFSFDDAVQLALPLQIVVAQGGRTARFDLAGNVTLSVDGGAPQPAASPGLVGITNRIITLVLPSGFDSGDATAQLLTTYEGKTIASNLLRFTL